MASSSLLSSRNWTYNVFASFHGPDVRKTHLSHMREQFKHNGITMFDDQGIERSAMIAPALIQGIRESRIAVLILSKKYASSRWCLDELLEILECQKAIGQIVMTIFYGVEASDVRNKTGEFGIAFNETCARKADDEKREKWSGALEYVGNIAGEDFKNWDNEAKMIKKLAKDISEKLHATPSRDFDGMVGLEAHLKEMECLLDLHYDGVKIVAISGPAGIGKSTIARALQSQLSHTFQLTCFMDNLRGSYHNSGRDEYGLKLGLQEQFLSKILKLDGIKISHLGVIKERLCKQRVLIILDDVNHIMQLEALANETTWFGPGSRIVVTTENKELLKQHGINNTYHVDFPSDLEAIEILCKYALKQVYRPSGFRELAKRVIELCGNLPLGLRVMGSSLRGKNEDEWERAICRLETIFDHRDIEEVLRVGFESLHENEQSLFLHIAIFFNHKDGLLVKSMFVDSHNNLDDIIKTGLEILVNRSLIYISTKGEIVMHKLLQQVGAKIVQKEEPWKRRILIDASDICNILEVENAEGARQVSGILFDTSGINELLITKRAFRNMSKLQYLIVYKSKDDGNDRMHIPEGMELPRNLRLLDWEAYPSKFLPSTFHPQYLVELNMSNSNLEKLWEGTLPLKYLKKMDLEGSSNLKELPDLSNATNLETLELSYCESLVEIPSSFSNLHKLHKLKMTYCRNLQIIPEHMNLASLEIVNMDGCSRLRNFPVMSTNIKQLDMSKTAVEDVPASILLCSRLENLDISDNVKLKAVTHLPPNVLGVNLWNSNIEKMPDCMKSLHQLQELNLSRCRRLISLPELPTSLNNLRADDCKSLKTVSSHLKNTPDATLSFINCFKLGQQARREIIRGSLVFHGSALLPGREIPAEFDHRARGNSLTIPYSASTRFKVCIVMKPYHQTISGYGNSHLLSCRILKDGLYSLDKDFYIGDLSKSPTEHLFIFHSRLLDDYIDPSRVRRDVVLGFSCQSHSFDVIECGAKIWTGDIIEDDVEFDPSGAVEDDNEYGDLTNEVICEENLKGKKHTDCWSWLISYHTLVVVVVLLVSSYFRYLFQG